MSVISANLIFDFAATRDQNALPFNRIVSFDLEFM